MDFYIYKINMGDGRVEIEVNYDKNVFGISYSGSKKVIKQMKEIAKDLYLYYGVSEDDVYRMLDFVYTDYETFYKEFKNEKSLVIQAHPFRKNCVLQNTDLLDGIEVFNLHPNHNSAVGFAAKTAFENPRLLKTGGTDFHHETHQGMCATLFRERIKDSFRLAEVLKSRDYILDIWGNKILPY